jgi:hypothetical protein
VGPEVALALGRDDDLPHGEAARLLGQRIDEPPVARARPGPDARVAYCWCTDELVEREVVRLG